MSKSVKPVFRPVLHGRRGFAKLRSATSFSIWRGRRQVLAPQPFPKSARLVSQRRAYLEKALATFELERLKALAKRRRKAAKKRIEDRRKKEKKRVKRAIKAKPEKIKVTSEDRRAYLEGFDLALEETLNFRKAYAEPSPPGVFGAEVVDTLIIPVEPARDEYEKRVIEKMMFREVVGNYELSIMDFSLAPEEVIEVNNENKELQFIKVFGKFYPPMVQYYRDTHKTSDAYILRLKFSWSPDQDSVITPWGISLYRTKIHSIRELQQILTRTYWKLEGGTQGSKSPLIKKYLTSEQSIFITGFTLEAVSWEK
jgi:hypothetical protein